MKTLILTLVTLTSFRLVLPTDARAQTQQSDPTAFARFISQNVFTGHTATQDVIADLMFITKYTDTNGADHQIITFGDTFVGSPGSFFGNSMAWSDDFDLSDGWSFHYKVDGSGHLKQAMVPKAYIPHGPNEPDAGETRIWFSRSFVLGQDIYTYYNSFDAYNTCLGTGLAVIRGGISDFNNIPDFQRVPGFWQSCYWFDGHPIVKTESDGNTYLYLFNQFLLQRVLFTGAAVENIGAYQQWTGSSWVQLFSPGAPFPVNAWTDDLAWRPTCEWSDDLHKWISVYLVWPSLVFSVPGVTEIAYRTADELTGPWSDRTIIYHALKGGLTPGDPVSNCYSPVHRSFYDNPGRHAFYTFLSCNGSQGPAELYEYTFSGRTFTTSNLDTIPQFAPQGMDGTANIKVGGLSAFYFADTPQYGSAGNYIKTSRNSYLYTQTDFDPRDGLSFDRPLHYSVMKTVRAQESRAWITAGFKLGKAVMAFYRAADLDGNDFGWGVAYTKSSKLGHFTRKPGRLPLGGILGNMYQVLDRTAAQVLSSDENDPSGKVYAVTVAPAASSAPESAAILLDPSKYAYSWEHDQVIQGTTFRVRGWSSNPADALELFDNALKPAIFHNAFTGMWLAIYTVKNSAAGANSQIAMRTALDAFGPWSDPVTLYSVPNVNQSKGRLYDARYLQGYDQEGGKVVYFYASDFDTNSVNLFSVRLGN
jgi:hypothetical protein